MPETAIVTGGAGFIGSHVVDALLAQGRRGVVVDDLSSGDARRIWTAARGVSLRQRLRPASEPPRRGGRCRSSPSSCGAARRPCCSGTAARRATTSTSPTSSTSSTACCARQAVQGVFNVATGVETSVAALFDMLQRAAGTSIEPELAPLREGELERSCMDPARAQSELGWEAKVPLDEGLASTYHALIEQFKTGAGR